MKMGQSKMATIMPDLNCTSRFVLYVCMLYNGAA